jgi:signal transduction histidine kinase
LGNAIKFTEEGAVKLKVKAEKNTPEEVVLQFCVQDSGIGIAADKKGNIFDRFQQAEAETTRRFGGTGLGLSIVKQLVELKKGSINVVSELGKGSQFIVTLPFVPVYNYYAPNTQKATPPPPTVFGGKKGRILIAEDNSMNQHLIRHLMNYWQLDYTLVNNGVEAVAQLRNQAYSMVLMDIQMPEMDGYATTRVIRNELKSDIPIIDMTAHAMAGEREKCLSYGMNEYISKPIKEAELYNLIQQYTTNIEAEEVKTPKNGTIISLDYLRELSMGDATFEQAIMQQFINQIPEELMQLKTAIDDKNYLQIKSIAHGLKSSVAYLGLHPVLQGNLQRMEAEAMAKTEVNHFEEDWQKVTEVCQVAIRETREMLTQTI